MTAFFLSGKGLRTSKATAETYETQPLAFHVIRHLERRPASVAEHHRGGRPVLIGSLHRFGRDEIVDSLK
jgi:hypothetical protein